MLSKEIAMSRISQRSIRNPAPSVSRASRNRDPKSTVANPEEFGKKTSPVRERLARDVKEMPPEERLKQGR
jgi:hypothetical protein